MLDDSLPSHYRLFNVRWYLPFPYYRLFNVGWLPFLKITKFRVPSLKIKKFRVISCSCFLIDMKFISKLLWILLMQNWSSPVPHLRKNILRNVYSKFTIFYKNNARLQVQKINKSSIFEFWAFKIMKYWFCYTKMKQRKSNQEVKNIIWIHVAVRCIGPKIIPALFKIV